MQKEQGICGLFAYFAGHVQLGDRLPSAFFKSLYLFVYVYLRLTAALTLIRWSSNAKVTKVEKPRDTFQTVTVVGGSEEMTSKPWIRSSTGLVRYLSFLGTAELTWFCVNNKKCDHFSTKSQMPPSKANIFRHPTWKNFWVFDCTDVSPQRPPPPHLINRPTSAFPLCRLHKNERISVTQTCVNVTSACETIGEILVGEQHLYFVGDKAISDPSLTQVPAFRAGVPLYPLGQEWGTLPKPYLPKFVT